MASDRGLKKSRKIRMMPTYTLISELCSVEFWRFLTESKAVPLVKANVFQHPILVATASSAGLRHCFCQDPSESRLGPRATLPRGG